MIILWLKEYIMNEDLQEKVCNFKDLKFFNWKKNQSNLDVKNLPMRLESAYHSHYEPMKKATLGVAFYVIIEQN